MRIHRPVAGPRPATGTAGGTCHHCGRPLAPCPLGTACPGTHPLLSPDTCRVCSWGAVCPRHDRRWIRT